MGRNESKPNRNRPETDPPPSPSPLQIGEDVYMAGKALDLLRLCNPRHYAASSRLQTPPLALVFSWEVGWPK